MSPPPLCSPRPRAAAFSLIELLTVMAVMAVLMSLVAPAFTGLGKSSELGAKGFQVAELTQMARQNAMAKNALTALIIADDPSLKDNGKLITLFELPPAAAGTTSSPSSWKQAARWSNLGGSVVMTDYVDGDPVLPVPLPAITFAGQTVGSYRTLVFLPDGSLLNTRASLRLVTGHYPANASTPVITGARDGNGDAADYCAITVLPATGKVKIDRP